MNAAIFIYLAEVLGSIGSLCTLIGFVGLGCFVVYTINHASLNDEYHHKNWTWVVPLVFIAISCFVPSNKTMYLMAGAVLGEKVLESKTGQQLQQIVELKLDEEIAKIKKEVTK